MGKELERLAAQKGRHCTGEYTEACKSCALYELEQ